MSHRGYTTTDRTRTSSTGSPRAIVHKQILDAATSRPEAAMEAIADEVSGATTDLVEQVLEEYGDPAETVEASAAGESPARDDASGSEGDGGEVVVANDGGSAVGVDGDPAATGVDSGDRVRLDPEAFTETQLKTLRAIHARPEATQADLAAEFDITSASINQRITSIEGLDWPDRRAFTEALFGTPAGPGEGAVAAEPDGGTAAGVESAETGAGHATEVVGDESSGTDGGPGSVDGAGESEAVPAVADQLDVLSERVDRLGQHLEDRKRPATANLDPGLIHKVAHACLQSEAISEDEELRILEGLLASDE